MGADLEQRIVELETRLAFQEQALAELSDALAAARVEATRSAELLRRAMEALQQSSREGFYADPAEDPWSPRNMPDPNFITRVQLPPPGADVGRFPDTIRYILDHTRSDGTTVLQECPRLR